MKNILIILALGLLVVVTMLFISGNLENKNIVEESPVEIEEELKEMEEKSDISKIEEDLNDIDGLDLEIDSL